MKRISADEWDDERVRKVADHYDNQTEDEAVAEDEAAFADPALTMVLVPKDLVPAVIALIAEHEGAAEAHRPAS